LSGDSFSDSAVVTGGTGVFANVTGSFSYTLTPMKPDAFTLTGSGNVISAVSPPAINFPLTCLEAPGASGSSVQNCSVIVSPSGLVFSPGGSVLVSGGSVLTFDGSGGSASIEMLPPAQSASVTYSATASCSNAPGACWIALAAPGGTIPANSLAGIAATVNPQGLSPGLYRAIVAIALTPASGQPSTLNVPIAIAVGSGEPVLTLSQTGVQFQALSGATSPVTQSVSVLNTGTGSLSFSAAASALSGGNWLSVSPSSGAATIQANPAGLAPGVYSGRVDFVAAGALTSPQSVEVSLTILPSTAIPGPVLSSSGLVFVAPATGNPAPQTVQVSSSLIDQGLFSETLTIGVLTNFNQGNGWFTVASSTSSLGPSQPATETVTVNTTGLAAGVYVGTVDFHAAESGTDSPVSVLLVVPKGGASCTPTQLLPVFTNLEGAFQLPSGVAAPVQVRVVDDCGNPFNTGSVTAYFPAGDPSVPLTALGNGQWSGTWMPHALSGGPVTVGVIAASTAPALSGSVGVSGALAANATVPLVNSGGVVSAASLAANAPIAPGDYISIFGSNLASAPGATQVFLGGEAMPLQFAGNGQINAVAPYDVAVNTTLQLIVQQGTSYSMPETVMVAQAQPSVFTQDQSGAGAGVIAVATASGAQFVNTPSTPASAGDALVIYCAGLGAVTPPVPAGSAAPLLTLSNTVNPVTATIGGQPGQVFFAGLAPGYVGLYQVNVIVPTGIAAGAQVPLILSVAGASSPPVTVAIR
jgi:uncharacterized protein (TIGR03437 family)